MDANKILEKIIDLDQEILKLQDQFEEQSETDKRDALVELFDALSARTKDAEEVPLPLIRVTEMICTLVDAAEILATGVSHPNEDVRHMCGEALVSIAAEDGVEAILPAVQYALERGDISAREMPLILSWVDDPTALPQIHRFLTHDDAEIVYSAIEACAEVGDMDSIAVLKPLVDDDRQVAVEEEEENGPVTIGMLAKEAISLIESAGE